LISGATTTFDPPAASADRIQPAVLATMKAAFAQVENVASAIRERDEQSSASPREANPTPAPFVAGIPRLRVRPGTLWRDWQPCMSSDMTKSTISIDRGDLPHVK